MKITSDHITVLKPGQIFVFGSNESGRHGAGAAKTAMKWGARYGQAFGLQGQTYGIPTMNASITAKLSLKKIQEYIDRFYLFAKEHCELEFLVTEIGCGLAGFTVEEITPLFKQCATLPNISLPRNFWQTLTHKK